MKAELDFSPELIEAIAGQVLAVYQPSKRVKPADLTSFFEKSWELFLTFPTA